MWKTCKTGTVYIFFLPILLSAVVFFFVCLFLFPFNFSFTWSNFSPGHNLMQHLLNFFFVFLFFFSSLKTGVFTTSICNTFLCINSVKGIHALLYMKWRFKFLFQYFIHLKHKLSLLQYPFSVSSRLKSYNAILKLFLIYIT